MTAYQLLLNWGVLCVPAGTVIAPAGVAFGCLARSGVSLSGAVWIVVAAMVVQGIHHPLQRPLLAKYSSLEVACYAMIADTVMMLPLVPLDLGGLLGAGLTRWLAAIYPGLYPSAAGFVL